MKALRPLGLVVSILTLAGCAHSPPKPAASAEPDATVFTSPAFANTPQAQYQLLNRLTFGANVSSATEIAALGSAKYLAEQLHPHQPGSLSPAAQNYVDSLTISTTPVAKIVTDMQAKRAAADAIKDDEQKKAALREYQQEDARLTREITNRTVMLALYSPNQVQEQMVWFWVNHFNIYVGKGNAHFTLGDFEQNALRAHALGRFRDLLAATVYHPAMLAYLDNEQNAVGHINENYARELMELHTLGVNGGYSQGDVQELARVLTGLGVNLKSDKPKIDPKLAALYVKKDLVEFNPQRHDQGDKRFLGHVIKGGRGIAEIDQALDLLAQNPSTASFISRKLATYWVSDSPSAELIERMRQTFLASDGDIASVLRTLFASDEFAQSLGKKFKDPVHYVVSCVRIAYDNKPILNPAPVNAWINRLGEGIYAHTTPEGYLLTQTDWSSSAQMYARFEVARAISSNSAGMFKSDAPNPREVPAFPQLSNVLYFQVLRDTLTANTRYVLEQAASPQEWGMLLLASPDFMNR